MKIITISGLDGSGKSTQIKLLKKYLEEKDKKVFYFHAIDFSIGNKIFLWKHKKNKKIDIGIKNSSQLGILLRKIALYIDIWRFKKLYKKLAKDNFDYILSDRFFYDTIINIEYLSKKEKLKFPIINNAFKNYKIISFYLKIEPKIIIKRKRVPGQGLKYLEEKNKIFNKKTHLQNWKILNGDDTVEKIFQDIKNKLFYEKKQNHDTYR